MDPKIEIKVDNKELAGYLESFLEDFKQVASDMLSMVNTDRGATLKIPDSEYNRLKRVAESLDALAKRKFQFENTPDFNPMIDALGRVQKSIERFKFPEKIACEMPEMEHNIAVPEFDSKPFVESVGKLENLFLSGIGVRITNFDEMPMVFDKVTGATGSSGGGDASEATLQSILTQLTAINTNTDTLEVKAESINLNTDTLEALIGTSNTNLGNIATSVGLIDDAIYTDGSGTPSKGIAVMGTDGTNPQILKTDSNGELQIDVLTMPTVAVTGTFWQATQPVSIAAAVAVTDNSGSLTVDAPVGTPVFVRLSDGASAITTLPVSLASVPSHAVTNAGTFVVQENGAALTALQLIDDAVATIGSAVPTKGYAIAGTDGTNARLLKTDSSGELQVDVLTMPTVAVTQSGTWNLKLQDGDSSVVADVLDLTNSNPLSVAIVDGSGTQITSFGGGTQYTEGDTDASITGTAMLWEDTGDTLRAVSAAKPLPVAIISGAGSGGTASADDADFTAGTTSGTPAMGVYESTPTNVTDGDMGIVGITIDRKLKTSSTIDSALPAGTNNIGDVDVLTVPADPFGANADAASATGSISAKLRFIASTGIPITGTVTVGSHAVTNAGTFVVQENGAALTALQLIDDIVYTDDTSTHSTGSSKGALIMAAAQPTDTAVNANDIGAVGMTTNRSLYVSVQDALPAGDNNIGNVDIVSGTITTVSAVTSITNALPAGTNALGKLLPPDIDVTTHTNYAKKYYTNAGAVTDGIIWSPAAGKRWHVVSLFIQVSAACTVTLEDDKAGGDEAIMKMELAANSGITIPFPEKYPLASGEDAADLIITTTAGNVYVTCVGYEI